MKVDVIIGLQWGDEGKGKIVDVLTNDYDVIARFQGGPNAGHTLEFDNIKHILHTIPSGIFHKEKINLIGNGVIIDPSVFIQELNNLSPFGIDFKKSLFISNRAHLILPTHKLLDACLENNKGNKKIGSTLKGIGPAYTDKIARSGLRAGDILRKDFIDRFNALKELHIQQLRCLGMDLNSTLTEDLPLEGNEEAWLFAVNEMKRLNIIDSEWFINDLLHKGKRVLAEGAQGTMLDVDFGSYPFVTSSNTTSAAVSTGLGISPRLIGEVNGVFKAYCTRVGSGPFPTELNDDTGQLLRVNGNEFGSTTGRPRRCGWIDLPALRYAAMINGVTGLIITKADVMNEFDKIKLCHSYLLNGEKMEHWSYISENSDVTPQYIETEGWRTELGNFSEKADLPEKFKAFLDIIERDLDIPVKYISTGPDRSEIIKM